MRSRAAWRGVPATAGVGCRRPASSRALGVALAGPSRPTAALVGDVAFLHDQGALVGAVDAGAPCTLVVVDNDGGGIFSFLPQADALPAARFEQLFGTPRDAALAHIAAVEGFDRGRYAGPVGWVDASGNGEWAVGIRSATLDDNRARLVAGVGVVGDSEPEAELAETQLKLQALLAAVVRP